MKKHTILADGAAINDSTGAMTGKTWCDGMTVHVSAAPTTAENFVVTLDAADGGHFDTVLYSLDLSAAGTTDIFWTESFPLYPGDAIKTTYSNTDHNVIGVRFLLW